MPCTWQDSLDIGLRYDYNKMKSLNAIASVLCTGGFFFFLRQFLHNTVYQKLNQEL